MDMSLHASSYQARRARVPSLKLLLAPPSMAPSSPLLERRRRPYSSPRSTTSPTLAVEHHSTPSPSVANEHRPMPSSSLGPMPALAPSGSLTLIPRSLPSSTYIIPSNIIASSRSTPAPQPMASTRDDTPPSQCLYPSPPAQGDLAQDDLDFMCRFIFLARWFLAGNDLATLWVLHDYFRELGAREVSTAHVPHVVILRSPTPPEHRPIAPSTPSTPRGSASPSPSRPATPQDPASEAPLDPWQGIAIGLALFIVAIIVSRIDVPSSSSTSSTRGRPSLPQDRPPAPSTGRSWRRVASLSLPRPMDGLAALSVMPVGRLAAESLSSIRGLFSARGGSTIPAAGSSQPASSTASTGEVGSSVNDTEHVPPSSPLGSIPPSTHMSSHMV